MILIIYDTNKENHKIYESAYTDLAIDAIKKRKKTFRRHFITNIKFWGYGPMDSFEAMFETYVSL